MAILSITTSTTGQVDVNPRIVKVVCNDTYATVTTAGYLNGAVNQGLTIQPTDMVLVAYGTGSPTSPTTKFFTPSFATTGIITLSAADSPVILPVVSGDFANFSGTTGSISDAGYSPTNAAKTKVVMANAAVTAQHIASYTDTAGTIGENSTVINAGNIQAGLSGTAGSLNSYPPTAAKGALVITAANNAGNTATIITNASMGQASTLTIPDPSSSTANFVVAPSSLLTGNLINGLSSTGLIVDAGFSLHSGTTAAYAGGGTTNAFVTTNMTSSSIVTAVILTSTNSVSITKAVPGTNTLTITFSADPGANTTVSWIATSAAA